jgi:hypothetical protein
MLVQIVLLKKRFFQMIFDKFGALLSAMSVYNGKDSILSAAIKALIDHKPVFLCISVFSFCDTKAEFISSETLIILNLDFRYNRFQIMTRSEALLIISKSEVTADSSRDWEKLSLA